MPQFLVPACCCCCCLFGTAGAEAYMFERMPLPERHTVKLLYLFHVYSKEDAPDTSGAQAPSVTFLNLSLAHSQPEDPASPKEYHSAQLILLPFDSVATLLAPEGLCSSAEDVLKGRAGREHQLVLQQPPGQTLDEADVKLFTLSFPARAQPGPSPALKSVLGRTGRYVLGFANCGEFVNATVTGGVVVQSPHGYLPGNEYHTMVFYWRLVVLSACVCGAYFILLRPPITTTCLQWGVGGVALLCLGEAAAALWHYADWNAKGHPSTALLAVTIGLHTLKYLYGWRLTLVAAEGADEDAELPWSAGIKFAAVAITFVAQQTLWRLAVGCRHAHALSPGTLLSLALPGCCTYVGLFGWSLRRVRDSEAELRGKGHDQAAVLAKVWSALATGLVLAALVSVLQLADVLQGGTMLPWRFQWLPMHGAPSLAFLLVLAAAMAALRPRETGWRPGSVTQSADGGQKVVFDSDLGPECADSFQMEDVLEEDREEASLAHGEKAAAAARAPARWGNEGGGSATTVAPEAIGAAQTEKDDEDCLL